MVSPRGADMTQKIENIVIHHSAGPAGCAVEIDRMHRKQRGWTRIGYNAVFLNGYPNQRCWKENQRHGWCDGWMEWGRPFDCDDVVDADEVGAHAYGWNRKSFGLCMIGGVQEDITPRQLLSIRSFIIHHLLPMTKLPMQAVIGHNEVPGASTLCPGINMDLFRHFLADYHLIDDFFAPDEA